MLERFLTGKRLLSYIHFMDRIPVPITILFGSMVLGIPILLLALRMIEFLGNFNALGYERAVVVSSTIRENNISRTLHLRARTKAGTEFYIITKNHALYEVTGKDVCLKIFESPEAETRNATLVALKTCAEHPEM